MERTIVVHAAAKDVEIPVKATIRTLQLYRAEFGTDLIKDLTAAHEVLHPDPFAEAMRKSGVDPHNTTQEDLYSAIMANMDFSRIDDNGNGLVEIPDGETQIKAMQILWAMAKTASESAEKFLTWCEEYEMLPTLEIVDRCFEIWKQANSGTVELKN